MKEIVGYMALFALQIEPDASQLAICRAKFMHTLLHIQYILKILQINRPIPKNIIISYSKLSQDIYTFGKS